jgi:hypothetical protein
MTWLLQNLPSTSSGKKAQMKDSNCDQSIPLEMEQICNDILYSGDSCIWEYLDEIEFVKIEDTGRLSRAVLIDTPAD